MVRSISHLPLRSLNRALVGYFAFPAPMVAVNRSPTLVARVGSLRSTCSSTSRSVPPIFTVAVDGALGASPSCFCVAPPARALSAREPFNGSFPVGVHDFSWMRCLP